MLKQCGNLFLKSRKVSLDNVPQRRVVNRIVPVDQAITGVNHCPEFWQGPHGFHIRNLGLPKGFADILDQLLNPNCKVRSATKLRCGTPSHI